MDHALDIKTEKIHITHVAILKVARKIKEAHISWKWIGNWSLLSRKISATGLLQCSWVLVYFIHFKYTTRMLQLIWIDDTQNTQK